jgi:hypothetical protein
LDKRNKHKVQYGSLQAAADDEGLEYYKFKGKLGNEPMLVLGFDGSEYSYSASGTGSPTIIRLGLWEGQVQQSVACCSHSHANLSAPSTFAIGDTTGISTRLSDLQ